MSKKNLTVLVGDRKNKAQKLVAPPLNAFWSDIQNPPIVVIPYQPPVRSLTEVPLDISTNVQPDFILPEPALVQQVSDVMNSPYIPSTSNAINKTTVTASKTPFSAANTGMNFPPMMTTKKAAMIAKRKAKIAAKIEKALAKNAAKANADAAANPSGDGTNKPNVTDTTNKCNVTNSAVNETNVTVNTTNETKPNADQPVLSKWQRRKLKRKSNIEQRKERLGLLSSTFKTKPDSDDPPKTEEIKPTSSGNDTTQDDKDTKAPVAQSIKGFTIPKLVPTPKPTIVLTTKKNLQTEMEKQRMNFVKPNSDTPVPAEKKPETASIWVSKPTDTDRSLAVFATAAKTKISKAAKSARRNTSFPFPRPDLYGYNYPKGIPRSFLKNQQGTLEGQQMVQTPGGQQMAPGTGGSQQINSDSPIWPNINMSMPSYQANAPTLVQAPQTAMGENADPASSPIFVQTENQPNVQQPYSPSDIYSESNPEPVEELEAPETPQNPGAQKRLSAFQRLGPVSQPKKPKLTINLTLNKEQPVREVINDTDDDPDRYTPVHLRKKVINSTDETVVKYLPTWPWRRNIGIRRSATARHSRSVMILEQEQMEEAYDKDNFFIQISVKGYPSTWTKERVLDAILDSVKGYSLIPCFIQFYQHECKFLTLRSRSALVTLHKTGFYIHKDGVELTITISQTDLTLNQVDFIPRIVLRKRVAMGYTDKKLNLSAFTLQEDISHFIYYPLNNVNNQSDFVKLQSVIAWDQLTDLDLSHNRLTNISGFNLNEVTPRLKHLNLSHNRLEKITTLLGFKGLLLKSIWLEGNPLCNDYIDPDHYVKVLRMMFPTLCEIDGIPIQRKGELAHFKQNYCTDEAKEIAEKFLEVYFPLLDSGPEHRSLIQAMYEDDAMLTITYCYKLRYSPLYRCFRNLFLYARFLDEGETDSVVGAMAITKLINRWPHTEHDPFTFTVDVMYHTETTTILRIGGILKLTAETLAEDEHLISFTRTVVLYSEEGDEYKIHNEMIYWNEPTAANARSAFRVNTISQKKISLKIESTADEDLKENYLKIFMKLTTMDKAISERCLEMNDWNFKLALEHFTKLLKLNKLDSLTKQVCSLPLSST